MLTQKRETLQLHGVLHLMVAISAKAPLDGEPCVTYIGPGGAGHYVKMVHNGIEYGDMQLIAESYNLLKHAIGPSAEEFHAIFKNWNEGVLSSFLIEPRTSGFPCSSIVRLAGCGKEIGTSPMA